MRVHVQPAKARALASFRQQLLDFNSESGTLDVQHCILSMLFCLSQRPLETTYEPAGNASYAEGARTPIA